MDSNEAEYTIRRINAFLYGLNKIKESVKSKSYHLSIGTVDYITVIPEGCYYDVIELLEKYFIRERDVLMRVDECMKELEKNMR